MKTRTERFETTPKMYPTENDIPENRRSELNALMNQRLADAVDLQLQMKQAHWNVKGPHFIGLHELFDQIDEAVESYVDLIAERIAQLGGVAEGTVRVAAERSRLEEYPLDIADGHAHVEAVSKALSTFGHEARKTIDQADELNDADTADIFTEISRGMDKWLWFVEDSFGRKLVSPDTNSTSGISVPNSVRTSLALGRITPLSGEGIPTHSPGAYQTCSSCSIQNLPEVQ